MGSLVCYRRRDTTGRINTRTIHATNALAS
jgi:hypothetical protein